MQPTAPFHQARLRLTAWYVATAIVLLAAFNLLVIQAEQTSYLRVKRVGLGSGFDSPSLLQFEEHFAQYSESFKQRLAQFNALMIVLVTLAGYFLSGRTLRPIQRMVQQQQAFAADVSHELRTPLTTIGLEIEHYLRSQHSIPPKTKDLLLSISEETTRMKHIVEGMLSVVRLAATPNQQAFKAVALDSLIKRVQQQMTPVAHDKQQYLEITKIEPVTVKANKDQLKQVLLILLDNAIKYSPAQSVTRISLGQDSDKAVITVTDQGVGISANEAERIFSRFYRSRSAARTQREGVGLGLAIAKHIVSNHGGTIKVNQRKPRGSVFKVSLPLLRSS